MVLLVSVCSQVRFLLCVQFRRSAGVSHPYPFRQRAAADPFHTRRRLMLCLFTGMRGRIPIFDCGQSQTNKQQQHREGDTLTKGKGGTSDCLFSGVSDFRGMHFSCLLFSPSRHSRSICVLISPRLFLLLLPCSMHSITVSPLKNAIHTREELTRPVH